MPIEKAIDNAIASLQVEGLYVSDELKALLIKKMNNEISEKEYIRLAMALIK